VKGSKTQVLIERDGFENCAAIDRKSERKPDIALEKPRQKPVLVLAGEMTDAASGVRWLLGNASLLTATYGKICLESNCIAIGRA
jgi:hypothetical protein